jgi:hypothetical protein
LIQETTVGLGPSAPRPALPKNIGEVIQRNPSTALKAARARDLATVAKGSPRAIVVVSGQYDATQKVLSHLGIPHTVISLDELGSYNLKACQILIVNCDKRFSTRASSAASLKAVEEALDDLSRRKKETEEELEELERLGAKDRAREMKQRLQAIERSIKTYEQSKSKLGEGARVSQKLRGFVKDGGFLFTSDWGLTLLEAAFPGKLSYRRSYGPASTALSTPPRQANHPLLAATLMDDPQGTHTTGDKFPNWELDGGSYLFEPGEGVDVLLTGLDLPKFKSVAATFTQGKGRVLHILSHFAQQSDKFGDYALQSMLLNFILERIGRKPDASR